MPQSLFDHVDLYCERLGPGLFAEPLNLFSNLVFILAGLWAVREMRRHDADGFAVALGWGVVVVGVGSALFHSFANWLTAAADVLPIASLTLAYTLYVLRRLLGMSWPRAIATFVAFYAVAGLITYMVPDWLRIASNGSTGYLPAVLALLFLGAILLARGNSAGWYNFAAAATFAAAVTFRMIDPIVCESLPIGTHFLWHVLNGFTFAIVLAGVAWQKQTPAAQLRSA